MKRWQYIAIAAAALLCAGYYAVQHASFNFNTITQLFHASPVAKPSSLTWQTVDRPDEGFRIDLPADSKDVEVPAYNESGSSEPVKMIYANPDPEITYAVTWEDNPPVARVNSRLPERTLDMARDGMLARSRTTLVSDQHIISHGYPAREVLARNAGGGVLSARLIYAGERLYTLMALYPSSSSRHEQDVKHFFNSFVPASAGNVPESVPAAPPAG